MKKITIQLSLLALVLTAATSCNNYRSLSSATSVSQLAGNPFMQSIAKTLLRDVGNMLVQQGISKAMPKLGLNTQLSSLLTNATAINAFKGLLSNNYKVNSNVVEQNFGQMKNLGNVVGFLAQNANVKF
jgi:hypothetical protein